MLVSAKDVRIKFLGIFITQLKFDHSIFIPTYIHPMDCFECWTLNTHLTREVTTYTFDSQNNCICMHQLNQHSESYSS